MNHVTNAQRSTLAPENWRQVVTTEGRVYVADVWAWVQVGGRLRPMVPADHHVLRLVPPLCTASEDELLQLFG